MWGHLLSVMTRYQATGAASSNGAFSCEIWVACTPIFSVSVDNVLPYFSAPVANFALNAAI